MKGYGITLQEQGTESLEGRHFLQNDNEIEYKLVFF